MIRFEIYRSFAALVLFAAAQCAASTPGPDVVHETVTIADLVASQGFGATEIASHDDLEDPGNVIISHVLDGGYNATTVSVSGTIRGEVTDANWFRDAQILIQPQNGLAFPVQASLATEVTIVGQIDVFESTISSTLPFLATGFGQRIESGPAVFEFYELTDDRRNSNDNSFTDLTIEFIENTATPGVFELGTLSNGFAYNDDTHSHVPGGLDFFNFTLPSAGTVDIETLESENGPFGFDITDTEIGLFDGAGRLVAQNDENLDEDGYSELLGLDLPAGDYTLVTSSFNSSLIEDVDVGADISLVTPGEFDGDYALALSFTSTGAPSLTCDFDGDGACDPTDLNSLYDNFGSGAAFDQNGDGQVDADDIASWLAAASSPSNPFNTEGKTFVLGDANFDGTVNSTDLGLVLNSFNDDNRLPYGSGNLNGDTNVNSADLGLVLNNFNFSSSATSAVPEPALPFWGWLVALAFFRRKRNVAK